MIKTVLIDDERPALRGLEFCLNQYPMIEITGMYTNPLEALQRIGELNPQVVFLDINMPQLQGIDAASRILDKCPDTDIVFVTAYDQYALEAFEIHALDYLLKPLTEERLEITITRLLKKYKQESQGNSDTLEIKTLGTLYLGRQGEEPLKWRSEKTKELFAYLLLNHGRNISKEELLDRIWPEDDPDRAIRQLYNGIYYIRKALGDYGVDRNLISIDSNYNLKIGTVNFDLKCFYEFEKGNIQESIEGLEELVTLYAGDFLESEYYSWADLEREKLKRLYRQCLLKLARKLIDKKIWDKAENYLLEAYHKDPYDEESTELLLNLYIQTGNKATAVRHYQKYADCIKEDLGIKPSDCLKELITSLK